MSNITAGNITNNSASLNYFVDNSSRNFSVFVSIFNVAGTPTFQTVEAGYPTGLVQTRGVSPFGSLTDSVTVSGLTENTTHSFFYAVTRDDPRTAGFDPTDVIFRRPLNPPGTYRTLGKPEYTDTTIASPGTVGTFYSDGVSATAANSFSISSGSLPPGISLASNTGAISGTPNTAGFFAFTVSANNSFGSTLLSLTLTINPLAPVFTDQTLTTPAVKDAPYSDQVQATNNAQYQVTAGALPTGLSLGLNSGAVTGTPTVEGTFNFTIQAFNVTGAVSAGFTIQIITGVVAPVFTDSTLSGDLRVGIAYSDGVLATDAVSYATTGTFVPGLTLNTSSGAVTGTPTAQGTFAFGILATNAAGTATANFSLSVKPGVRRYDGTQFVFATIFKRYNGTEFVDVTQTRRFNGTTFVPADL